MLVLQALPTHYTVSRSTHTWVNLLLSSSLEEVGAVAIQDYFVEQEVLYCRSSSNISLAREALLDRKSSSNSSLDKICRAWDSTQHLTVIRSHSGVVTNCRTFHPGKILLESTVARAASVNFFEELIQNYQRRNR